MSVTVVSSQPEPGRYCTTNHQMARLLNDLVKTFSIQCYQIVSHVPLELKRESNLVARLYFITSPHQITYLMQEMELVGTLAGKLIN